MDDRRIEMERFTSAIELIRSKFPELQINVDLEEPNVHAVACLEEQPELDFDISIDLQNCDELAIIAESLWASYFPIGEEDSFEKFIDAIIGLISGNYRIVEYRVLGSLIKTTLEKPCGQEWLKIYTCSPMPSLSFLPLPRKKLYIQNLAKT